MQSFVFHYVSVDYQFESTSYTTRYNISLNVASRLCDTLEYHTGVLPLNSPAFSFIYCVPSIVISISPITFWDVLGMLVLSSSESELERIRILFLLRHTFKKFSSSLSKDPSISTLSVYSEPSLLASLWPNSY